MYHVYEKGYSVLPQLNKLGRCKVFQITLADLDYFLAEKQKAVQSQRCFVESEMTDELYETVCNFILAKYPFPLQGPPTFENLCLQIQEDVAIHRLSPDRDWLAAGHICFPSGWWPEEKIGKPLSEIHAPIPGMDLTKSRKLVETMVNHGPFDRYVWSVVFEDKVNYHPSLPKKEFDPASPAVFVKVERQIIWGFPEHQAALFVLRQHLIRNEINKPALLASIQAMTPEQREYKGLTNSFDPLCQFLAM